ncbi:hypothetical protein GGS24DRAFT_175534 [Hypoxylon argillaceum]|nr:hypothetical protein GGS24DRAFT_175534 [Hypoxylon argillaceum]KAI1148186.1 hypothetical protein F4825DRAFT_110842 [Nemania diffusa]
MVSGMPGRGGWNTNFGWDVDGGPPPIGQSYMAAGVPTMPYGGGVAAAATMGAQAMAPQMMAPQAMGGPIVNTPNYMYPQQQQAQYGYMGQGYTGGGAALAVGGSSGDPSLRLPQPHPYVTPDAPGINMVNSTGGAGCEPGYNYIFHHEHTKVHVFRATEPPWRAPGMHYTFAKFQVPTNTTIAELMVRFGAINPEPTLNRITEVVEGGNGTWYRGMIFQADEEISCSQTLKDCGWDGSRSGRGKAVVWLWVTKD